MGKRIYLAGPEVFFPNSREIARSHKEALARYGLEGVFPLDNEIEPSTPSETARRIFEANYRLIDSCDAVLANMTPFRGPSMDVGTAWEMGYAFAHGKPVFGYTESQEDYKHKIHRAGLSESPESRQDIHGHEIEHYEGLDNLMLTHGVTGLAATIDEAASLLVEHLGSR